MIDMKVFGIIQNLKRKATKMFNYLFDVHLIVHCYVYFPAQHWFHY